MSGVPYFNFPEFFRSEEFLINEGWQVLNPAKTTVTLWGDFWKECPSGSHEEAEKACWPKSSPTYKVALRMDLMSIFDKAEAIALMPGWERSKGATIEKLLADALDLRVIYL